MSASREPNGRYLPGHALAGPGRPPRQQELQYVAAITRACPASKLYKVVRMVLKAALDGDVMSQALILKYTLPDPARAFAAFEAHVNQPLRVAGYPSREAAYKAIVAHVLQMSQEVPAQNGNGRKLLPAQYRKPPEQE